MSEKNINFQKLYLEKKYSEIITEIENLDEKQRSSGLLNRLGACKLLRRDNNDLISVVLSIVNNLQTANSSDLNFDSNVDIFDLLLLSDYLQNS